jgi:lysyl-tRNA synthetase class 2
MSERQRLAERRAALEGRARILRAVRGWFDEQGFLSVETPARVPAPGQEVHLDAFPAGGRRYLVTSPEYHMKRLLGAGYQRIVQIGKAWRAGEVGPHHQPEFLIAEWYRAGAPLSAIADDCEALLRAAGWTGAEPFERTTVRDVMRAHAGIDLAGDESAEELASKARAAGVYLGSSTPANWDDVFFQAFLERVEPRIGRGRPTFVFDWPAPLGALARRKPEDPRLVDRFELYANGLELANAFGELTDPVEQRARFAAESETRAKLGKTVYDPDERLLAALPHIGQASGVALGLDRLVMLVLGKTDIRDVVAFTDDET